jgi:hypothetical protein
MDDSERSYLPWLMAALILVIGGAKLEFTRPYLARVLAVAIPVVPVAMGLGRLRDAAPHLERAANGVAALVVVAGEICVAGGFFGVSALSGLVRPAQYGLYAGAFAALLVHVAAVQQSSAKVRFAAFVGIASVFAVYLSSHPNRDAFAGVFGAFFVALFVGGGAGLFAGEIAGRVFKRA